MADAMLLRPEEAAEALGIGRSKTYAMLRSGELPVIYLGRSLRVPVVKLQEWINERAAAGQGDGSGEEREGGTSTNRPVRRRA